MSDNLAVVESKPKRFQITVQEQLYLVLDCLSDIEGYDSVRIHVATLISQYCKSKIMQLRDDPESSFYQCWEEIFETDLDDEAILNICKL